MKTILIIDDDMHIGDMLEEVLTREGYGVLRAYSGTEALMLLSTKAPDLVLLDLMLPGLSGEEVLPKIKGIPVIVVSAKIDVDNKVDLLLGGAVDYVTKPFNTKELLARIAVALRGATKQTTLLYFDDITLNTASYAVFVGEVEVFENCRVSAERRKTVHNVNVVKVVAINIKPFSVLVLGGVKQLFLACEIEIGEVITLLVSLALYEEVEGLE